MNVVHGNCLDVLRGMDPNSVDSFVEDPPYGLGFMGSTWDFAVPGPEYFEAQLRVAKPGSHLVAFGGTRVYHRLTCAIEDAGWDIRDCLMWLYGEGFPKSLDVSKAIDKAAGAERAVVGANPNAAGRTSNKTGGRLIGGPAQDRSAVDVITAPATEAARQWEGWGTALKPAWEPIILARKPLEGTVAENVQRWGTGALNIDGCRIGTTKNVPASPPRNAENNVFGVYGPGCAETSGHDPNIGRWPANVILDPEAGEALDEQSGASTGGVSSDSRGTGGIWSEVSNTPCGPQYGDSGGASRFFYCAKAIRAEREAGCQELPAHPDTGRRNSHPTVKPVSLMAWLCRLVTPHGGLVVDPFCGSGSTGCGAVTDGFRFLGIEKDEGSAAIARARVAWWAKHGKMALEAAAREGSRLEADATSGQMGLFK